MTQGTVKHYDPQTGAGTVLLDDQREVAFDAEALAGSGLIELRLGQRVRFELDAGEGERRLRWLRLVSL